MFKNKLFKYTILLPIILYTILFIALPLCYILFLSFCKSDNYGGVIYEFTLMNYLKVINWTYIKVFLKSFGIGILASFICLCISYPFAIILKSKSIKMQNLATKIIMIPFLTNSLIRTYGWIILLRKNGVINSGLQTLGLISKPLALMYNNTGIIIGMTYTLLPFMLLPICAAVFKIDNNIIEAAKDLGASPLQIFFNVIIPETLPGMFNGFLMVFMPAIGYFFICDILGGGKVMIIGSLIKNQFLQARNWPFGSALSIVLILITFLFIKLYKKSGGNMDDLGGF